MSNSKNTVTVTSVTKLIDNDGNIGSWIGGKLDLLDDQLIHKPDYFKLLVHESYDDSIIGKNIDFNTDDHNYFFMMPENNQSNMFFGSDINSGIIFYGDTEYFNTLRDYIDNLIVEHINTSQFIDFEVAGFSYMQWYLKNSKSLLILHNDQDYGLRLSNEIMQLPIISLLMGGNADDLTAPEILIAALIKDIKKIKVDEDINEEYVEELEESWYSDDYLKFAGNKLKKTNKKDLIHLAHFIICQTLNWQNPAMVEDEGVDDQVEIAKRIRRLRNTI